MNWRVLMQADSTLEKSSQNPQNSDQKVNFENIEKVFGGTNPPVSPKDPLVGQWIEFKSPVFGSCTGQVVMTEGDRLLVDHHSILRGLALIQTKWVQKTIPQPPGPQ